MFKPVIQVFKIIDSWDIRGKSPHKFPGLNSKGTGRLILVESRKKESVIHTRTHEMNDHVARSGDAIDAASCA